MTRAKIERMPPLPSFDGIEVGEDGRIINGHLRWRAAKELGIPLVKMRLGDGRTVLVPSSRLGKPQ